MIDKTQYKPRNLLKYLIAVMFAVPTMQILYVGWVSLIQTNMPITYWIEYDRAEPIKDFYGIDEPLVMKSYYKTKRETEITFDDLLMCDWGEGYIYVSEQVFNRTRLEPANLLHKGITWVYSGDRPIKDAKCYIKAVLSVNLDYAQDKKLEIETKPFKLEGCRSIDYHHCDVVGKKHN